MSFFYWYCWFLVYFGQVPFINLHIYSMVSIKRWRCLKVLTRRNRGGKKVVEKWKVYAGSREKRWRSADTWRRSLDAFTESWKLCFSHRKHSHTTGRETCEKLGRTIKNPELFAPKTLQCCKTRPDREQTLNLKVRMSESHQVGKNRWP